MTNLIFNNVIEELEFSNIKYAKFENITIKNSHLNKEIQTPILYTQLINNVKFINILVVDNSSDGFDSNDSTVLDIFNGERVTFINSTIFRNVGEYCKI